MCKQVANKKLNFSVEFKGLSLKKVDALKKYFGIESNADLIKTLVIEKAQQLNKMEATPPNDSQADITAKLPKEIRANYNKSRKNSPTIEALKIAAAFKLWNDRGFSEIKFDVPIAFGEKTVFVKVLAKHSEGTVFGIECAATVRLGWLKARLAALQKCLPRDSYMVAVFPETAGESVDKVIELADEVWVTGKNGKVEQMMFKSIFHRG